MKVLAALGSFKDVYTSIESCKMVQSLLANYRSLEIEMAPVCDGGEYTYQVLNYYFKCRKEIVKNIYNPYGRHVTVSYLVIDDEAYIISSEILHLSATEEQYRNPLILSDYGLGQLVADAIQKKYRKICICLGGTSTIGFGMGFAQALGARFWNENGQELLLPITCEDIEQIERAEFPYEEYHDIEVKVINDGITRCSHLDTVNPLKIGKIFENTRDQILERIERSKKQVLRLTGHSENDAYSGNGGAIYYGIQSIFSASYCLGGDYFTDLFRIQDKIVSCDLVITGEGRFDNPHLRKIPIIVTELAKQYGKKVIFLCGQVDNDAEQQEVLRDVGIDYLISCDIYYQTHEIGKKYENEIEMYREMTPVILGKELEKLWKTNYSV